jgi:hypothetical protein
MLRFTIRDLLWLMVVVGLACGWWMDRRTSSKQHDEDRDTILEQNGELQGFEGWILRPLPAEDDPGLSRLREWAKERRDKREIENRRRHKSALLNP